MVENLNYLVFGWYPYLCLTVFLIGSLVRFDREQYTWRSGSSQLLRRRQLFWGSNLFHVGILVIFLGHFVGLLTPIWIFDTLGISHTFKQWLANRSVASPASCALLVLRCWRIVACSTRVSARRRRSATSRFS
jgi:respiratory nitrate reductase gamma subunit